MFAALLDASVLYPMYLRDSLLRVAEQELYRPLWSPQILGEVSDALEQNAGLAPEVVDALLALIREHFPDAEIKSYEELIPSLRLPDPDDRHVLAAAIKGNAEVLITANIRDFPESIEEEFGVAVQSPDVFLLERLSEDPERVVRALQDQVQPYTNPSMSVDDLLDLLGLPGFAAAVRGG
jgi:predicted nucleic acid-binding protein